MAEVPAAATAFRRSCVFGGVVGTRERIAPGAFASIEPSGAAAVPEVAVTFRRSRSQPFFEASEADERPEWYCEAVFHGVFLRVWTGKQVFDLALEKPRLHVRTLLGC